MSATETVPEVTELPKEADVCHVAVANTWKALCGVYFRCDGTDCTWVNWGESVPARCPACGKVVCPECRAQVRMGPGW